MIVVRLFHCPVHVYSGHHGRDPGVAPMQEASRIRLIAGRGVDGDRYSVQEGARGQVTFFAGRCGAGSAQSFASATGGRTSFGETWSSVG
jgi:hypothetical protein